MTKSTIHKSGRIDWRENSNKKFTNKIIDGNEFLLITGFFTF
jgi:hypothetical protein